jgi:hypothetical protein
MSAGPPKLIARPRGGRLRSSRGKTNIPRWPMRQGSALLMRLIVVRVHFVEPISDERRAAPSSSRAPTGGGCAAAGGATNSSRDEIAADGASRSCRRWPRLQGSGPTSHATAAGFLLPCSSGSEQSADNRQILVRLEARQPFRQGVAQLEECRFWKPEAAGS